MQSHRSHRSPGRPGRGLISHLVAVALLVTLRWAPLESAVQYEVQISSDEKMEKIIEKKMLAKTELKLQLPPGKYFFRIRGLDADKDSGPWSDIQAFQVKEKTAPPLQMKSKPSERELHDIGFEPKLDLE